MKVEIDHLHVFQFMIRKNITKILTNPSPTPHGLSTKYGRSYESNTSLSPFGHFQFIRRNHVTKMSLRGLIFLFFFFLLSHCLKDHSRWMYWDSSTLHQTLMDLSVYFFSLFVKYVFNHSSNFLSTSICPEQTDSESVEKWLGELVPQL